MDESRKSAANDVAPIHAAPSQLLYGLGAVRDRSFRYRALYLDFSTRQGLQHIGDAYASHCRCHIDRGETAALASVSTREARRL